MAFSDIIPSLIAPIIIFAVSIGVAYAASIVLKFISSAAKKTKTP